MAKSKVAPQNSEVLGRNANGTPANIVPPQRRGIGNAGLGGLAQGQGATGGLPATSAPIATPGQNSEINGYNANGTPASTGNSSLTEPTFGTGNTPASSVPKPAGPTAPKPLSALQQALMLAESGGNPDVSNQYMNQFQQSIAQARGDIGQQLAGALADINKNKGYAQQALGMLPAGINSAYGQAQNSMNNAESVVNSAMAPGGPNGGGNVPANVGGGSISAYLAPDQEAIKTEQAANLANVPLLGVGIQQAAGQEAASAQGQALADQGALAQSQAGDYANFANSALSAQQAAAAQKQSFLQSLGLAGVNNAASLADIQAQAATPSTALAGGQYANSALTAAQVAQAQADPNYAVNIKAIQAGTLTQRDINRLQAKYPTLYQTLLPNGLSGYKPKK